MCRKRSVRSSDIPLGLSMAMAQNPAAVSPQLVKEPVKDSINWDFVGG